MVASPRAGLPVPDARPAPGEERLPRGRVPGEAGIWVFIVGDMLIFGLFFIVYMAHRAASPALFARSGATLSGTFGAANTVLLLTGSLCVVQAVHALRRRARRLAPVLLGAAMLCGVAFAVDKVFEYRAELRAGHTPTTNDFYTFYFMLTGLHLVHLCIAVLFLTIALRISLRPVRAVRAVRDMRTVEVAASFWHLVDLLWIVLFPLLYLVR